MAVNMIKMWKYFPQGKIAKLMTELDDKFVDSLFHAGVKNKQGIFASKLEPKVFTSRELEGIETVLDYSKMFDKKLFELNSKYAKEIKKLKINEKESDFIIYKGSKTEGANKGYWALEKKTNKLYLIKYGNEAQVRSEQLASELYELGGIHRPKQAIVSFTDSSAVKNIWDSPIERFGIASEWMPIKRNASIEDAAIMREGFGMDCWLANWDAMKTGNTVMSYGQAARIDTGGALCYRARGGRKGAAFGENVGELTSFFENYSLSRPYIKDMTRQELLDSLKRVSDIPDSEIIETIDKAAKYVKWKSSGYHPISGEFLGFTNEIQSTSGIHNPNYLKETLIERRNYIRRFREACRDISQNDGETIQEYVKRIDTHIAKKEYTIPFDKILMSEEVGHVEKGMTMGERLSPSQKKIYDDSYKAYKVSSKNLMARPVASNILTTDSMLHSTNIRNLDEILENGVTSGDLRGAIGSGTGCQTQTPLCADFWDIQKNYSIKDYFTRPRYNPGEANFLPRIGGVAVSRGKGTMVVVVDKKKVASTLMENSFKVSEHTSPLYKDGNMAGHMDYVTHRAVPYGVPANSIDRIIINAKSYKPDEIASIKNKITQKGLNIKLYDLQGNLL